MIDHDACHFALRNRARAVTVATTGSTSLSGTATGYARAAGSFLTDNFRVGMEITSASGFSVGGNNITALAGGRVITFVDATTISCAGCAVDAAASGRTLTAGMPLYRAFENVSFSPVAGRPFIEEDYVPATHEQVTMPSSGGLAAETGIYFIRWYGLSGTGHSAIRKGASAIVALFTPGTTLTVGSDTVRMRESDAAKAKQIVPAQQPGWSVCPIEIPFEAWTRNVVAA